MPANFPEMWESRVRELMTSQTKGTFLEGIEELSSDVQVSGEGTITEQNTIHIPTTDFEVDVLINNGAYPLAVQNYTDATVTINLDKYQTKVMSLSDDQAMGSSYSKIDAVTRAGRKSMTKAKFKRAIHALAPPADAADTPLIETTGDVVAAQGNRKRLRYEDLVTAKAKADELEWDDEGRRIVLSTDHYNDLLLIGGEIGKALIDYRKGGVSPVIAGWEIHSYVANPYYDSATKAKKVYGEAPVPGTDFRASVIFHLENVAKKTGKTKQYFAPAGSNPKTQTNELAYRHYFICTPIRQAYHGAIISVTVA